jgi:hypothetical protein
MELSALMRIHIFTDPAAIDLGPTNVLVLGPHLNTTLTPAADGLPIGVDLEAMMEFDPGEAGLLLAHPRTILELGLRPSLPVVLYNHANPPALLRFWFDPPPVPVELTRGQPLCELLLLEAPLRQLYHDLALADKLAAPFSVMGFLGSASVAARERTNRPLTPASSEADNDPSTGVSGTA